jgi:hypothetical protein
MTGFEELSAFGNLTRTAALALRATCGGLSRSARLAKSGVRGAEWADECNLARLAKTDFGDA